MSNPRLPAKVRRAIIRLAGGSCEYCRSQMRFSGDPFSIDHIMPRARDGSDEMDNLALCCLGCNNIKFISVEAFDPVTREIVPLYHPRRQRWSDHFDWNLDFTLVVGLTPTGRATIEKLQLNREGLVNYRRVLAAMGEHPPADPIRRRRY